MIVGSKQRPESEAVANYHDSNIIIFTVRHKGVTIKAHCQAFDIHNYCKELVVGETYDFERDDKLRFLTVKVGNEKLPATLGIDEEHSDRCSGRLDLNRIAQLRAVIQRFRTLVSLELDSRLDLLGQRT